MKNNSQHPSQTNNQIQIDYEVYKWLSALQIFDKQKRNKLLSNGKYILDEIDSRNFENGKRFAEILKKLVILAKGQEFDKNFLTALGALKDKNNAASKLYNWNLLQEGYSKIGILLDPDLKSLLIAGDIGIVNEFLKDIYEESQNRLQKLVKQNQLQKSPLQNSKTASNLRYINKSYQEPVNAKEAFHLNNPNQSYQQQKQNNNNESQQHMPQFPQIQPIHNYSHNIIGENANQNHDSLLQSYQTGKENIDSLIEFMVLSLSQHIGLGAKQVASLFSSGNKYLAHLLVKGIKNEYLPLTQWLQGLIESMPRILQYIKSQEKPKVEIEFLCNAVKPALLSKNEELSHCAALLFSTLIKGLNTSISLLKLVWQWFSSEHGGFMACVLCLRRHSNLTAPVLRLIVQIARFDLNETLTAELRQATEGRLDAYFYVCGQLASHICGNNQQSAVVDEEDKNTYESVRVDILKLGVVEYWLEVGCKAAETSNNSVVASVEIQNQETSSMNSNSQQSSQNLNNNQINSNQINSNNVRIYAVSLLTTLWMAFPLYLEDSPSTASRVLNLLKKSFREKQVTGALHALSCLFKLLHAFAVTKNKYAPIVYKTLTFSFIENHQKTEFREFLFKNFEHLFLTFPQIPIQIFLEPLLKQLKGQEQQTQSNANQNQNINATSQSQSQPYILNICDIEFFYAASRHQKLSLKLAILLLDTLVKLYLNHLIFSHCLKVPIENLLVRYIETQQMQAYLAKLMQSVLNKFCELEQMKKLPARMASLSQDNILEHEVEITNAQKRAVIIELARLVLGLECFSLNSLLKPFIVKTYLDLQVVRHGPNKGMLTLLGMLGDAQRMVKELELMQQQQQEQELDNHQKQKQFQSLETPNSRQSLEGLDTNEIEEYQSLKQEMKEKQLKMESLQKRKTKQKKQNNGLEIESQLEDNELNELGLYVNRNQEQYDKAFGDGHSEMAQQSINDRTIFNEINKPHLVLPLEQQQQEEFLKKNGLGLKQNRMVPKYRALEKENKLFSDIQDQHEQNSNYQSQGQSQQKKKNAMRGSQSVNNHLDQIKKKYNDKKNEGKMREEETRMKEMDLKRQLKVQREIRNMQLGVATTTSNNANEDKDKDALLMTNLQTLSKQIVHSEFEELELVELDKEEDRDMQSVKLYTKKHCRMLKWLFERYASATMKPQGLNAKEVGVITSSEAWRLLSDYQLSTFISKPDFLLLCQKASNKHQHKGNFKTLPFSFEPFCNLLAALSVFLFCRPPYNKADLPAGMMLEELLRMIFNASQLKYLPIDHFDHFLPPKPTANNNSLNAQVETLNKQLEQDPSVQIPADFVKVKEDKLLLDYGLPSSLTRQLNEPYMVCSEVVTDLVAELFGLQIREPFCFFYQITTAKAKLSKLPQVALGGGTPIHNIKNKQVPQVINQQQQQRSNSSPKQHQIQKQKVNIPQEVFPAVINKNEHIPVVNQALQKKYEEEENKKKEELQKEQARRKRNELLKTQLLEKRAQLERDKLAHLEEQLAKEIAQENEQDQKQMRWAQHQVQLRQKIDSFIGQIEQDNIAKQEEEQAILKGQAAKQRLKNLQTKKALEEQRKQKFENIYFQRKQDGMKAELSEKQKKEEEKARQIKIQQMINKEKQKRESSQKNKQHLKQLYQEPSIQNIFTQMDSYLRQVFEHYCKQDSTAGPVLPPYRLPFAQFVQFAAQFNICPGVLSDLQVKAEFNQIIKEQEERGGGQPNTISFEEFQQCLLRVSILGNSKLPVKQPKQQHSPNESLMLNHSLLNGSQSFQADEPKKRLETYDSNVNLNLNQQSHSNLSAGVGGFQQSDNSDSLTGLINFLSLPNDKTLLEKKLQGLKSQIVPLRDKKRQVQGASAKEIDNDQWRPNQSILNKSINQSNFNYPLQKQ